MVYLSPRTLREHIPMCGLSECRDCPLPVTSFLLLLHSLKRDGGAEHFCGGIALRH
jgi:hypothetical protein